MAATSPQNLVISAAHAARNLPRAAIGAAGAGVALGAVGMVETDAGADCARAIAGIDRAVNAARSANLFIFVSL